MFTCQETNMLESKEPIMFTVALIGQKGGGGKTTIAVELAVAAVKDNHAVVLIDLDQQTNAANWKDRRAESNPIVAAPQLSRLRQTLETARSNGANFVVIDTPGKSDSAALEAARFADLVLIPARTQVYELETIASVRDLLRIAGDPPAYVLLNGLHPSATKAAEDAKIITAQAVGMKVCPIHLCQRDIYKNAPATGQTAQELEPDGAAADEIMRLYMFINEHVHMSRREHGKESSRFAKGA
jgi:chromosome partitioning protein